MEKNYRELFDGIRASGRLRRDVMDLKNLGRREAGPSAHTLRPVLAAVLTVLLLGTAACAAVPGAAKSLADYFSGRWKEHNDTSLTQAQLDFIENFTQTVGVSDTCNGVTVTLEAVTAGESSLWMLLSVDGLDVPAEDLAGEDVRFSSRGLFLDMDPEAAYNYGMIPEGPLELRAAEDGKLMLTLRAIWDNSASSINILDGHQALLLLQGIRTFDVDRHLKARLAEGSWRLEFTLEPAADPETIILRDVALPAMRINTDTLDWEPSEPRAKEIRMTSTEMHIYWNEDALSYPVKEISLLLDGGAEVGNAGAWPVRVDTAPEEGILGHFIVPWDLPVDLSRAAAIRVGDQTIPLK